MKEKEIDAYVADFGQALAAELRAARARQRITFDQLAAESGLSRSAVANYIGGYRDIPVSALVSMSAALDTDPRAIFNAAQDAVQDPRRPDAS